MPDPPSQNEPEDAVPTGRYTVIARRYRPQSFEDLVGQEHVARALQQAITTNRVGHAYLFTGARGVGKTSAARILAKALNCVQGPTPQPCNECDVCTRVSTGEDIDVLEIDGASNRGIDEIRQLRQNVAVRPSRDRYKIYIIDEVHMLTKEAFNALLKTLEEPPEHVKFIFATTEPQKIPITILSRCQRFDFAGIRAVSIQERLDQIATAEGVALDREASQILASRAAGSMRDSQSLLEQLLAVGGEKITAAEVNNLLGIAPAERLSGLARSLVDRNAPAALAELDATIASGVEVGLLLDQLVGYFRDVMAMSVGCTPDQLLYALPSQADEISAMAGQLGVSTVLAIGQILDQTSARMRVSMHGRTLVEMAVVRICQLGELDDLAVLIGQIRGGAMETSESRPSAPERATGAPGRAPQLVPPSKKNAEDLPSLANGLAGAIAAAAASKPVPASLPTPPTSLATETSKTAVPSFALKASPQTARVASTNAAAANANGILAESADVAEPAAVSESALAQFKRNIAAGGIVRSDAPSQRTSRREQLAKVAEQPFVRRAMELFDVGPGQFRYTPPEGDAS